MLCSHDGLFLQHIISAWSRLPSGEKLFLSGVVKIMRLYLLVYLDSLFNGIECVYQIATKH